MNTESRDFSRGYARAFAMARAQRAEMIALVLRVLMGAWFVYAGGMKVFGTGLDRFVTDIENYKLVSGQVAVGVAYFIPWLEIVTGICFMLGILRAGAWWAMLCLVVAFSVSVGSAWARGLDISCGCFGGTEKISYWWKALEFAGYFAALGYIAWVQWGSSQQRMNLGELDSQRTTTKFTKSTKNT